MYRLIRVVLLGVLFLVGCDTSIDPVRKETYSIYGYLSSQADSQFIRVKPLDTPLQAEANRRIDATVTLKNMDNGTTHVLQDSVIAFLDDGDSLVTHNFWTDADVQPKTTYRLEVKEDGELITSAETKTPTEARPTVAPRDGNCLTSFRVRFEKSERAPVFLQGEFAYDGRTHQVQIDTEIVTPSGGTPFFEFVPEYDLLQPRIPGNERIFIPFGPTLLPPRCLDLDRDSLRVRYVYASSNWHEFDVNTTDPGNFEEYVQNTQIQGGQGFFGALARGRIAVHVDTSDTLEIGAQSNAAVPKTIEPRPGDGHLF